ncbi:MAG: hypothetical protein KME20_26870 [Kaiparowitsia implicata GSE-PSE-MK54-09C]|jgi:hypothetical protein|nr:hypothetical protein [Kaiparowitsia implicata GSE-PSE-MK54-09C]
MASKAYFASLVLLPTIVTGPGNYVTRAGEIVTIETSTRWRDFACRGTYPNGVADGWHRSGRLYAGIECANDIVGHEAVVVTKI